MANEGSMEWKTSSATEIVDDIRKAFEGHEVRGFEWNAPLVVSPEQYKFLKDWEARYLAAEALKKARAAKFEQWALPGTYNGNMNRAQRRAARKAERCQTTK